MKRRSLVEDGLSREEFTEERLARLLAAVNVYEEGACEEGK